MQHLSTGATIATRRRLERGQRHLVSRWVPEGHAVELDAQRLVGQRHGVRALVDERLEVEHLEDAPNEMSAVMMSTRTLDSEVRGP